MSQEENKNEEISNDLDTSLLGQKKPQSFFEMILKFRNKININYNDFDCQKGELSPRMLFKKRKNEFSEFILNKESNHNNLNNSKNDSQTSLINLISNNIEDKGNIYLNNYIGSKGNKIKSTFDSYLDFVNDSYFSPETNKDQSTNNLNLSTNYGSEEPNSNNNIINNNFKFSSLDLLVNPLREKFIWEMWSPYEISLFECCVCKFNRNFDIFSKIVKINKIK